MTICSLSLLVHGCASPRDDKSPEGADIRADRFAFMITDEIAIDTTAISKMPDEPDEFPVESMPIPIYVQRPEYPETAKGSGTRGDVWVKAFVNPTGKIICARILRSDNIMFNKSALRAIIQWRFKPAMLKGKRVGCWVGVPIKFVLGSARSQNQ